LARVLRIGHVTLGARRIGRCQIVGVIGRGGMATVYLARQTDLDRDIALEELALFEDAGPEVARRFSREARLAGSFSHPNAVTVHDYLEHAGTP
jgi:serine/threonine protein kinase